MRIKNLHINIWALAFTILFGIVACDKHDTMDDNVIVGKMAPHVYWEINSSTVTAGDSVPFSAQYYTTSSTPIDYISVWYSVFREETKQVASPWMSTFKYSISSTKRTEQRISEEVLRVSHQANMWDSTLNAYAFRRKFPTPGTLSSTAWIKPESFQKADSALMKIYFGDDFMQHFKDSLYSLMKVKDFQNMYLGLNLIDNFKPYLDSVLNPNTRQYEYVFPLDASGNRPVPQKIADIYKTISFADLIFNNKNNNYEVEFTRSYLLKPVLKVVDKEQVSGVTSINSDVVLN